MHGETVNEFDPAERPDGISSYPRFFICLFTSGDNADENERGSFVERTDNVAHFHAFFVGDFHLLRWH